MKPLSVRYRILLHHIFGKKNASFEAFFYLRNCYQHMPSVKQEPPSVHCTGGVTPVAVSV